MTVTAPPSWAELVGELTEQGVLGEPWRSAFLAVPRDVFIPEVIWRNTGDGLVALHRAQQPGEWLRRACGPGYVITQVDDGTPAGPHGRGERPTSSASRPDIVALMLTAGQLQPGMRVLEIGTGTGYTAALLAHYLGARNVTTIEVDPVLAAQSRTALATAGYGEVTVITGDGEHGHPEGAPFDRVLSTVAAPRVPYPWVAQTRPGGLVLTPWSGAFTRAGLLSLTVSADGTATGGLVNTTISFMQLRDQRIPCPEITEVVRETDIPEVSDTDIHASQVCNDDAPFAIALRVPNCHAQYVPSPEDDDRWSGWFLDPDTRSWARFDYHPGASRWPVSQFGPRRLWDEITTAYHHWQHLGRPAATSWRFTITPHHQHITPQLLRRPIGAPRALDRDPAVPRPKTKPGSRRCMPAGQWTDAVLDRMRGVGDPLGDAAIYGLGKQDQVRQALLGFGRNSDTVPADLPARLQQYFQSAVLPEWADPARMERGHLLLGRYQPQMVTTLLCSSLPLCYGAAKGAQVLYRSQRLTSGVYRRLMETAQFVIDVLDSGGLGPGGRGVRSAQKIRLLHATMRYHVSRQNDWDPTWGLPINQEYTIQLLCGHPARTCPSGREPASRRPGCVFPYLTR